MEARGLEIEKIQRIMDSQAEEEVFRNYCDVTIDNSGSFAKTEEQIAGSNERNKQEITL